MKMMNEIFYQYFTISTGEKTSMKKFSKMVFCWDRKIPTEYSLYASRIFHNFLIVMEGPNCIFYISIMDVL
jgi:hypothetical protein